LNKAFYFLIAVATSSFASGVAEKIVAWNLADNAIGNIEIYGSPSLSFEEVTDEEIVFRLETRSASSEESRLGVLSPRQSCIFDAYAACDPPKWLWETKGRKPWYLTYSSRLTWPSTQGCFYHLRVRAMTLPPDRLRVGCYLRMPERPLVGEATVCKHKICDGCRHFAGLSENSRADFTYDSCGRLTGSFLLSGDEGDVIVPWANIRSVEDQSGVRFYIKKSKIPSGIYRRAEFRSPGLVIRSGEFRLSISNEVALVSFCSGVGLLLLRQRNRRKPIIQEDDPSSAETKLHEVSLGEPNLETHIIIQPGAIVNYMNNKEQYDFSHSTIENSVVGAHFKDIAIAIQQLPLERAELGSTLEDLKKHCELLFKALPTDQLRKTAARDLADFIKESVEAEPRKSILVVTSKGLIEAAKTVASVSGPIISTVGKIKGLLGF
jgi:hypothetical protein